MTAPKLTIELVPKSSWYSNVRSEVTTEEWDRLRKDVYQKAGYRCEVCGGKGPKWPVECHEVWEYSVDDDEVGTQRLVRMIALCPACHEVKHIGLAGIKGRREEATQHLADINGWTAEEAEQYIAAVFRKWERRSQLAWTLDLSHLDQYKEGE